MSFGEAVGERSAPNITLTERDLAILEHVARYRMSTHAVLQRLFFAGQQDDAVKSTLRRLRAGDFIDSAPLYQQRVYYHLTRPAARRLGTPDKHAQPLGDQSLAHHYGVLAFCCLGDPLRTKLTLADLRRDHPELIAKGLPLSQYYWDRDEDAERLGYIQVDFGADARKIVRKCRAALVRRLRLDSYRELIDTDRFLFAVVTSHESKADTLERAVLASELPVKVRIEVCPDLAPLL